VRDDIARKGSLLLSGLLGASGVALAAAATHTGASFMLGNASAMCLAHAPILLALHIGWERIRLALPTAILLGLGTALFAADLVCRNFTGSSLFPMAAPAGGLGMILGWLTLCASAFLAPSSSDRRDD